MNCSVIISLNASRDIDDVVQYYKENVSKKVALDFLADFQNTYKALKRNSFYKLRNKTYRFLLFKKFKYIVSFIIDEINGTLLLNAVLYASQDPDKYPKF
jgi:toxin ParE1/3/4